MALPLCGGDWVGELQKVGWAWPRRPGCVLSLLLLSSSAGQLDVVESPGLIPVLSGASAWSVAHDHIGKIIHSFSKHLLSGLCQPLGVPGYTKRWQRSSHAIQELRGWLAGRIRSSSLQPRADIGGWMRSGYGRVPTRASSLLSRGLHGSLPTGLCGKTAVT